jgi:hypothetical protein
VGEPRCDSGGRREKLGCIRADSCVELINAVGTGLPLNSTEAPGEKAAPLTVRVRLGPPTTADSGDRDLRRGGFPIVYVSPRELMPAPMSPA